MKLSKRILDMQFSPIRNLAPYAVEAKKRGIHVYHLNVGQPDMLTPKSFFKSIENFKEDVLKDTQDTCLIETKTEYQKRRDVLMEGLLSIPGVVCEKPTDAFYIVAKLPVEDAEDFAKFLLTDFSHDGKTVMVAPTDGFYVKPGLGKNEIRLSYCLNCEALKNAMILLKMALGQYKETHR